jgi:hypothetical protein
MTLVKNRILTKVGTISATNTPLTFSLPDMTFSSNGLLYIQASGGAITTPTWMLEASLDQGVSWFVVTATAFTATGLITGDTAATYAASYNVSGLGNALFHFGLTAGTGITAMTIYCNLA